MKEPRICNMLMVSLPLVFFCHAAFAVDSVLLPDEHEELNDEDDQRSLCRHVEAQREVEDRKMIQVRSEPVHNERKDEPDHEMNDHE